MFSYVQFLTMEENSFAVVNEKKPRKSFYIRERPVLHSNLEHPLPPNSHPPILAIKLLLAPKVTLL